MKKIEAIIRPNKLGDIKEELIKYGVKGMTVSEVHGCGLQKGHIGVYRGKEYSITLLPKMKVEIVVEDDIVEEVVNILLDSAQTGEVGDGKIFILPVDNVYRIRTRESGRNAL